MPDAMKIMYENADPAPELYKLNQYRTDGKDCMKFYTDPEFFFNIWCNELMKDNETRKTEKKRRKVKHGNQLNDHKQNNKTSNQQQQQYQTPQLVQKSKPNNTNGNIISDLTIYGRSDITTQIPQHLINNLPHDETYHNQFFLKQAQMTIEQHQQQHFAQTTNPIFNNTPNLIYHQQQSFDVTDKLPPPPPSIYASSNTTSNIYQAYNQNKLTIHQQHQQAANLIKHNNNTNNSQSYNERPMLPPPPIPDNNHISDFQQMQNQLIKKYDDSRSITHEITTQHNLNLDLANGNNNNDFLPPPPSPPYFTETTNKLVSLSQAMTNLNMMNHNHNIMTDSAMFDMPLPPPPIELQHHTNGYSTNNGGLPPPPPLPPLVESDTASSSSSSLVLNEKSNGIQSLPAAPPLIEEIKSTRNYLDDITKRRFTLKPTLKDGNNLPERPKTTHGNGNGNVNGSDANDTIQPFVNNSDVAAIIDFIRKFRPHVCDSSDDEENSDWDD